jgi:hypothetical protein
MNDLVKSEYAYGGQLADEVFAEWLESGMEIGCHSLMGESYRAGFIDRLAELLDVPRRSRNALVVEDPGDQWQQEWAGLSVAQVVFEECPTDLGLSMRGDCQCQSK